MEEEIKSVGTESSIVRNVREYVTRTGKFRKDKLRPIVFHDNRNGGTYSIRRNAAKREKREAAKNK